MAKKEDNGLIVIGYVSAVGGILVLPIIFMPAGIIIGMINASKGETTHGLAQILIAIVFGLIGISIGGLGLGL